MQRRPLDVPEFLGVHVSRASARLGVVSNRLMAMTKPDSLSHREIASKQRCQSAGAFSSTGGSLRDWKCSKSRMRQWDELPSGFEAPVSGPRYYVVIPKMQAPFLYFILCPRRIRPDIRLTR